MIGVVYALVALLAVAIGSTITFAVLSHKSKNEQLAARDMLDKEREEKRVAIGERDVETAAHAVTSDELRKEKNLRAHAESQRNQAYLQGRLDVVDKIKTANIADAQRVIADLLADPLPGLPPLLSEAGDTAADRDGLLDPFAVQPAADS